MAFSRANPQTGLALDVRAGFRLHGGAQIETAFPLHLDSLHEIRLELGDASVVLKGRVVHCSIADMDREFVTYRSGIEFIEPTAGARDVIARFIGAVKAGRLAR